MKILYTLTATLFLIAACTPSEDINNVNVPPVVSQIPGCQVAAAGQDLENTICIQLRTGLVVVKLFPDIAPNHVERIKTLARQGFYNGHKFHRVIDGFMAQTGDPTGTGTGGSSLPNLAAEFSDRPFTRGIVGMARGPDTNSANSQFFFMFADGDWLNGQYTVVGEVIFGMESIDQIARGDSSSGTVADPDVMIQMQVAADAA
jgi:peptidylprolyl isomerase